MPKSEEKEPIDPVAVAGGMVILFLILVLIMLAILLPGLYIKLWEWVY